jgi:4-amino-4-deoxy-L-arabinose transferase-like glycosyltransferase
MGAVRALAGGERSGTRAAAAWLVVLVLSSAALVALGYQARDPDSRLYAEIAARMADGPLAGWIAPDFPPGWFMRGPFREHPVGIHLLPALLARFGFPALQAAYVANALYQALSLVLLPRLAATRVPRLEADALGWLLQLLPIAFTFRIRANHEQAVLLCLLVALYGIERARGRAAWAVAVGAGLVGLLLVKGVLVVMGFGACALWLLTVPRGEGRSGDRAAWGALVASAVAVLGAAFVYDLLYRQATGGPFWSAYLGRQIGVAAVEQSAAGAAQKAYNLVWYLGRVVWFPFPWSLTLAAAALGWWTRRPERAAEGGARSGAFFALLLAAFYLSAFSLSDRRADRYLFPVYYAVGAAGAVAALGTWPSFRRVADRLDPARAWLPAALWLVLFALHIAGGRLGLPTVKVWAPDS